MAAPVPQRAQVGRLGGLCVAVAIALADAAGAAGTGIVPLRVAGRPVQAELADRAALHATGLMWRERLAPDAGMLFVFATDAYPCMWMRDTRIPLSVAFIDRAGRIVNIADMVPHSLDMHCATAPARYALEMNRGWFAGRAGAGDRVEGLAGLRALD